jgi:aspartate aminotransferase
VENIRLAGGVPTPVAVTAAHDYRYEPAAIARAITRDTAAIFLNTPHNPTGSVLDEATLREIVAIARENDLWIVSDEAYEDVVYAPSTHVSIASVAGSWASRVISVFSFSKSHAMSGLRTGYLVTRDAILGERIGKLLRCTINGVNSVAQWAALAAINGDGAEIETMRAEYALRRELMLEALRDIPGVRPFAPRGAFYLWTELDAQLFARLGVRNADELSSLLAAKGIGSTPGDAFGSSAPNAMRFAFSCSTEMVREGGERLREMLMSGEKN